MPDLSHFRAMQDAWLRNQTVDYYPDPNGVAPMCEPGPDSDFLNTSIADQQRHEGPGYVSEGPQLVFDRHTSV
jgi:hypothetical protein